jgi:MFS transporter, DHA2 family, multidrug resistance protein
LFKNLNFAAANLLMFMMGVMLFSTLVIIPEFLQTLMGYTAQLAGSVLSASGVVLLFMMPIVGRLTTKIAAKWLIATGWFALALGLFYTAYSLDLFVSFNEAMWLRVCQVIGIGFLFVPTTMAGYIGIPEEKGNTVSGIVNFMRNIGGSIGTSLVTTVTARRLQYHQQILVGHVTPDGWTFRKSIHALSGHVAHFGHSIPDAKREAIARLYALVDRQAYTLSYIDAYWILGVLAAAMFFLALFLRKNDPGAGGQIAAG